MEINQFNGQNRFLSNFYPCIITYKDIIYPTTEHAYQAAKTTDNNIRKSIAKCPTPGIAKRLGRGVNIRPDWEAIKEEVMLSLLRLKFKSGTYLAYRLVHTYPRDLIEGNTWHDNIWGDCGCYKCKNIVGQNLLGNLLMQVRDELRTTPT